MPSAVRLPDIRHLIKARGPVSYSAALIYDLKPVKATGLYYLALWLQRIIISIETWGD